MTKRISALLIAGPTASGKSSLALHLATAANGVILNADALQVYRDLRILTARPTPEDEARAPHRLYGFVPAATAYSVGQWAAAIREEISLAHRQGRLPIIVGGTGLYFSALLSGLSPLPPIPEPIRRKWRRLAQQEDAQTLHRYLAERDPETAIKLRPSDTQRLVRALEVWEATGRPLARWQKEVPPEPILSEAACLRIFLAPPRPDLRARIAKRFQVMLDHGVLKEVADLLALELPTDLPAMKAIGLAPLRRLLSGEISQEAAAQAVTTQTWQYAKRQFTWARRNMLSWHWEKSQDMNKIADDILRKLAAPG